MTYFLIFWLVCGFIAYGLGVNYWKSNWPTLFEPIVDRVFCIPLVVAGPFGILFIYFSYRERGTKLGFKV